ncbi:LysE family translocator [Pectobacterium polaris]|uniref:LysE family translocator n=1 Tax=Pectobacterium polaris TaxID=2042057 RepID=UPI001F32F1CB|nr:LysE family transporter [Pectobacterium polaris]
MDRELLALIAIGSTILLGAMSPGASFLLVAQTAVASSRRAAISASIGMGFGAMLFAIIALAGIHVLLTLVPYLYTVLKVAGGCYLLWQAFKIFRRSIGTSTALTTVAELSTRQAFTTGLMTQMSNPQTALVFASIFTATLNTHVEAWMYITLPIMAFVIDVIWYALVALALSTDRPRRFYMNYRRFIDRLSGGVMAALGLRLLIK